MRLSKKFTSPLYNGYLIQNKWSNRFVRLIDWMLHTIVPKRQDTPIKKPRRLLLVQPNHLGDVVLSTSIVAPLKKAFPDLEISFLVGSWSQIIVNKHSDIFKVHVFDHWRMNRSNISLAKKFFQHMKTFFQASREIRANKYDTAIVLSPYWANGIPVVYTSKIQTRIGYGSGGFGRLLTHCYTFDEKWHITKAFAELTSKLPCENALFYPCTPELKGVMRDFTPKGLKKKGYIVVQVGAGNPKKKWPFAKWKDLIARLESMGTPLVFTGQGVSESEDIERIIEGMGFCYNLSNLLSWDEYVSTISHARLFLGVDSVGAHIASCFDIPTVVITGGIMGAMQQFRPVHKAVRTLSKALPCNPCFFSKQGCAAMQCIRDVEPVDVLEAIEQLSKPYLTLA